MSATTRLRFSKMHGAGNDFVILDRRGERAPLSATLAARLADRHLGVGCDQVITIEPARSADSVASYGIRNADGSASQQCGNGARCVAAWLAREGVTDAKDFRLDSPAGVVEARLLGDGRVAIGMGVPDFGAAAIGLRDGDQPDPIALDFDGERLHFGAVSMGNPHAVIEVADAAAAEVARVGSLLQQHPAFLHGCNVGFAQILAPDHIRLRVNERGVGETLACGSGACAAVAVLARRGRVGTRVAVDLPGGTLDIGWDGPGSALTMTGPAQFVFEGEFIA